MLGLMVLYTMCEILVTNDSGPAHFASLTPINVVTLFGPETPDLFAARNSGIVLDAWLPLDGEILQRWIHAEAVRVIVPRDSGALPGPLRLRGRSERL